MRRSACSACAVGESPRRAVMMLRSSSSERLSRLWKVGRPAIIEGLSAVLEENSQAPQHEDHHGELVHEREALADTLAQLRTLASIVFPAHFFVSSWVSF